MSRWHALKMSSYCCSLKLKGTVPFRAQSAVEATFASGGPPGGDGDEASL